MEFIRSEEKEFFATKAEKFGCTLLPSRIFPFQVLSSIFFKRKL